MASFDVAHIQEQGQDMVIVPVRSQEQRPALEVQRLKAALQVGARGAGLRGEVVPVWENSNGGMGFFAPQPWHPFFQSLTLADVCAMLNRRLTFAG